MHFAVTAAGCAQAASHKYIQIRSVAHKIHVVQIHTNIRLRLLQHLRLPQIKKKNKKKYQIAYSINFHTIPLHLWEFIFIHFDFHFRLGQ